MKKLLKYGVCLTMLVMVLALFTGCPDKATGGGWFYDECSGHKCTFGFNAQLVEEDVYKGQFQFQDHETGLKFHMDEITWADAGLLSVSFHGEDKNEKWVKVSVTDMGEPGAGDGILGDGILIVHETLGIYAGFIDGGNIQLHEEKDKD